DDEIVAATRRNAFDHVQSAQTGALRNEQLIARTCFTHLECSRTCIPAGAGPGERDHVVACSDVVSKNDGVGHELRTGGEIDRVACARKADSKYEGIRCQGS